MKKLICELVAISLIGAVTLTAFHDLMTWQFFSLIAAQIVIGVASFARRQG